MDETQNQAWGDATLRIWSDRLTASEIGARLGLPGSRHHAKGEPVSSRNPQGPRRQHHVWLYEKRDSGARSPQRALDSILTTIGRIKEPLGELMRECEADVFVGWLPPDQSSLEVEPDDLALLGELGLALVFDVYGGASDKEADD